MTAIGLTFVLIGAALLWVGSVGVTVALGLGLISLLRKERGGYWVAVVLCTLFGGFLVGAGLTAVALSPPAESSSVAS